LKRIFEATEGKVGPNDFMGIERPPPQPPGMRGRPRKADVLTEPKGA
jgi:hypothetical protein